MSGNTKTWTLSSFKEELERRSGHKAATLFEGFHRRTQGKPYIEWSGSRRRVDRFATLWPFIRRGEVLFFPPVCFRVDGRVEVPFRWMKDPKSPHRGSETPFERREQRQALLGRLNDLPGIAIGEGGLDTRPTFPMAVLEDKKTASGLLDLFDWYAHQVSSGGFGSPLSGARIPFASRSMFFDPIGSAVQAHREDLAAGRAVTVQLSPEGYEGKVTVQINEGREDFETDWRGSDRSRFPARIKAAATVLQRKGFHGRFRISHAGGELEMRRIRRAQKSNPSHAGNGSGNQGVSKGRTSSPALTEEELVLVLDAYFRIEPESISKSHPQVKELARLLRQLPIHPPKRRPKDKQFRSDGGVRRRLGDFKALDEGKTDRRVPAAYEAVWERYEGDSEGLREEARRIRRSYNAEGLIDGGPVASDIAEPKDEEQGLAREDLGGSGPAPRIEQKRTRIIRDSALANDVKAEQDHCCQLCATVLRLAGGKRYAEAHHVKPLGRPHDGPDVRGNITCVCPNCHAKLDFGAVTLKASDLDGVSEEYVDYHNEVIADL